MSYANAEWTGSLTLPSGLSHPLVRVTVTDWVAVATNPATGRRVWRADLSMIRRDGDRWVLTGPGGDATVGPPAARGGCGCGQ